MRKTSWVGTLGSAFDEVSTPHPPNPIDFKHVHYNAIQYTSHYEIHSQDNLKSCYDAILEIMMQVTMVIMNSILRVNNQTMISCLQNVNKQLQQYNF